MSDFAVLTSSKSDIHLTPLNVLKPVIYCLKQIDLDPCSNSKNNPNVAALNHYTEEDNGLIQEWKGKIFINPPFSKARLWVKKFKYEISLGNISEAIFLCKSATDTTWYRDMSELPFCFWNGRMKFYSEATEGKIPAPFPCTLFYYGKNYLDFKDSFLPFGRVYKGADT